MSDENEELGRYEEVARWEARLPDADRRSTSERGIGDGLCARCQNGCVFRRHGRSAITSYCHLGGRPILVPSDIEECSDYRSRKPKMSLDEMHMIGLFIDKRKAGGQYL